MPVDSDSGSGTIKLRDLAAEDARRVHVEARRKQLHQRLDDAFGTFHPEAEEQETADLVRAFLAFVADNIHAYATRSRVQNPENGETIEAEWVTLCGATIGALDVADRIRHLILDLVDSLMPEEDRPRREQLWQTAGVPFRARASAADLSTLQKQGMLASFAGKLLVDSKHLVAVARRQEADAYFETARRIAAELQASPYQTARDRRFLGLLRKQYNGGLLALVDAQRDATLADLTDRDEASPGLERVLRGLLERPYSEAQSRSLEDWAIANRITYQSEAYVYTRIDEFREEMSQRMSLLEARPMHNPEAVLAEATQPVASAVARMEALLARHGATVSSQPPSRLDVMQLARENAALLSRPELVPELDAWLTDEALVDAFARYKVASFRCAKPSLKNALEHDLVLWDELLRSAPLSAGQQARLETLREALLAPLRGRGEAIPEDLPEPRMILPFGRQVLPLLQNEEDYSAMGSFLSKVRATYSDPTLAQEPPSPPVIVGAEPARVAQSPDETASQTRTWVPTLLDVPGAKGDDDAHPEHRVRSATEKTWIHRWSKGSGPAQK